MSVTDTNPVAPGQPLQNNNDNNARHDEPVGRCGGMSFVINEAKRIPHNMWVAGGNLKQFVLSKLPSMTAQSPRQSIDIDEIGEVTNVAQTGNLGRNAGGIPDGMRTLMAQHNIGLQDAPENEAADNVPLQARPEAAPLTQRDRQLQHNFNVIDRAFNGTADAMDEPTLEALMGSDEVVAKLDYLTKAGFEFRFQSTEARGDAHENPPTPTTLAATDRVIILEDGLRGAGAQIIGILDTIAADEIGRLPPTERQDVQTQYDVEMDAFLEMPESGGLLTEALAQPGFELDLNIATENLQIFANVLDRADYDQIPAETFATMTMSQTLMSDLKEMGDAGAKIHFVTQEDKAAGNYPANCLLIDAALQPKDDLTGDIEFDEATSAAFIRELAFEIGQFKESSDGQSDAKDDFIQEMVQTQGGGIFNSMLVDFEILIKRGPEVGNKLDNEDSIGPDDQQELEAYFMQELGSISNINPLVKMQVIQELGEKFLDKKIVEVTLDDGTAQITLREMFEHNYDGTQPVATTGQMV